LIVQFTVTLNVVLGQSTPGGTILVRLEILAEAKAILLVRGCNRIDAGARTKIKINDRTTRNGERCHTFIDDLPYA